MENIYKTMEEMKLVKSQYDYSKRWLGKSPSYYSVIKSGKLKLGLKALLNLQKKLNLVASFADQKQKKAIHQINEMVMKEIERFL